MLFGGVVGALVWAAALGLYAGTLFSDGTLFPRWSGLLLGALAALAAGAGLYWQWGGIGGGLGLGLGLLVGTLSSWLFSDP